MDWKPLKEQLKASLSEVGGLASDKVDAYLLNLEPQMVALATVPPEHAGEALKALDTNARLDLAILGVAAEAEAGKVILFAIRFAAGLLRSAVVV